MRYSTFLQASYCASFFVYLVSLLFAENQYGSIFVFLAFFALVATHWVGVRRLKGQDAGLGLFFSTVILIFIVFRVLALAYSPEEARFYGLELQYSEFEVAYALLIIVVFSAAFFFGLAMASGCSADSSVTYSVKKSAVSYGMILLLGLFPQVLGVYMYVVHGSSRGGEPPLSLVLLSFFTNKDIFTVMTVALAMSFWAELSRWGRFLFVAWSIVYVILNTLTGGKGGVYSIVLSALMVWLMKGDFSFRISIGRLVVGFLGLSVGMLFYALADGIRYAGYASGGQELGLMDLLELAPQYMNFNEVSTLVLALSRRLSHFENIALMVNVYSEDVQRYLSLSKSLKVFVNFIAYGTPFPDSTVFSLQLFKVAYLEFPIGLIDEESGWHGDYIPVIGMFYIFFGVLVGLPLFWGAAYGLAKLYQRLLILPGKYVYFWLMFFWFSFNTLVNDAFGLDHFLQKVTIYALSSWFYIFLFKNLAIRNKLNFP